MTVVSRLYRACIALMPAAHRAAYGDEQWRLFEQLVAEEAPRDRVSRIFWSCDLLARGLGASAMYGASLEKISGVPDAVRQQGPFPNAANLADRLFTLPTHGYVTSDAIESAARCIEGSLSDDP